MEEKKKGGGKGKNNWEKKKIKTFLVATNAVASQPPERRPNGMPTACANTGKFNIQLEMTINFQVFFESRNKLLFEFMI